MPAILPPARVLLTGANGFIAGHIASSLIEKGYAVIGTVRTIAKGKALARRFGQNFTFIIIEDMRVPDAFVEVFKYGQYDAIIHSATVDSPSGSSAEERINTAVTSMRSIINAVVEHGHSVKRFLWTGSIGCIIGEPSGDHIFTESDWSTNSVNKVKSKDASDVDIWRASKFLSEHTAWKIIEQNAPNLHFDLTTLHPSFVMGPLIVDAETQILGTLNQSTEFFLHLLTTDSPIESIVNYIDVRDCAEAHVLALEKAEAGNQRIICSAGTADFFEWKRRMHGEGVPGIRPPGQRTESFDLIICNQKSRSLLGLNYRTCKDTLMDSVETFSIMDILHD